MIKHPPIKQSQTVIVTASQMQAIEARVFEAGMPVAALMEKVAGLIARRIQTLYPLPQFSKVGVLVGPGHNGGDALVVARELQFCGYELALWCPLPKLKPLTAQHLAYAQSLGIPRMETVQTLDDRQVWIDGLFGFGLEREIQAPIATAIDWVNGQGTPIVSIDLPSGLHTDTGKILGTACRATHTLCLGLWKRGLLQDRALATVGQVELIDFDLTDRDITAVLGTTPPLQRLTPATVAPYLPLPIPPASHKYQRGRLLLIAGSRRYRGAAVLAGFATRASGVGLVSIAVPTSLQTQVSSQLPEALIIPCAETETGAIAHLPEALALDHFDAIACGPGLTLGAERVVAQVCQAPVPLLLDADGLNLWAQLNHLTQLTRSPAPGDDVPGHWRSFPTVLTPHPGEFKRLFPDLAMAPHLTQDQRAQTGAARSGSILVLKGARTVIAQPQGGTWVNPHSTPALARGGSGDVLTGLMGGFMAVAAASQPDSDFVHALEKMMGMAKLAVWCHAQGACLAAQAHTNLGVNASILGPYLSTAIQQLQRLNIQRT
jgi:NAD(P)H-hydrate epimerase